MVNFKKIGVAAAMMLTALSAMASNFRVADQVYVPAAGHLSGASGTFLSDIFISNLSDTPTTVSVIFASGTGGTTTQFANLFLLAGKERREFVDFVAKPQPNGLGLAGNQFGQLIFNGCKQGGDCTEANQDPVTGVSLDFRNISVESRIYSIPAGTDLSSNPPTTGQAFPGFPWYSFVSSDQTAQGLDKVFITGVRNTGGAGQAGTYRGNIGLVNASQYSKTTLVVKLFNGLTGAQIGSDFRQDLQPLGQAQPGLGAMFPSFTGATATNAYVTVEQQNSSPVGTVPVSCATSGCPAFFAYGSVLDNASGDATTLEPQYLKALSQTAIDLIYPPGAGKGSIRRVVHH
ncbi:MAG: hypothetical protein ABI837_11325 [Acidobacteriota bacterium]